MTELLNIDCMEYMKGLPDKYFDLAIVDPPYGIEDKISKGGGSHTKSNVNFHQLYSENGKTWDVEPPKEYFEELFRISKNQIIWGGNYFASLKPCRGFICWDKIRYVPNFSMVEFAWTSFDMPAKIFKFCNNAGFVLTERNKKIHPTQKPIELYKYIFENFAKPGYKIIDTHLGSGSSAIVAEKLGFDFVGCEIDIEYYEAAKKRFYKETDLPLFKL